MSYSTSSIIPFDTGHSYVVRSLPLEPTEYRFEDKMGRTTEDRKFLEQFESIFLAASKGDLRVCKAVVDQGFCDFHAYSVGRYGTKQKRLDNISPLQIAQDSEHTHIVEYFKKVMAEKNSMHPSMPTAKIDPYFKALNAAMQGLVQDLCPTFQRQFELPKSQADKADTEFFSPSKIPQKVARKARIVLQGEFGIACGDEPTLKTTCPSLCTVIAFYNSHRRIAVLAHVDDYTSIEHMLNKISKILGRKFKTSLSCNFQATIAGGSSNSCSVQQREALQSTLAALKIKTTTLPLTEKIQDRPQITFDAHAGNISLEAGERLNCHLEYLQQREYGEFNNLLDASYGCLPGTEIPFFKAREATRTEEQLAAFEWISTAHAQLLENEGQIQVPIKPQRIVAPSFAQKLNRLEQMVASFKDAKSLNTSLLEKNFNLILRQAAANAKYFPLLKFLLEQGIYFKIDLTARGATSGTALDVARKFSNSAAIELLQKFASP